MLVENINIWKKNYKLKQTCVKRSQCDTRRDRWRGRLQYIRYYLPKKAVKSAWKSTHKPWHNICSKCVPFQRTAPADPQRGRQTDTQTDRQTKPNIQTHYFRTCSRHALFSPANIWGIENIETILKGVNFFRSNFFLTGRTEKFGVNDRRTVFLQ